MPVLFEGSVKDNLLLGKPDATEQEIIAATKAANASQTSNLHLTPVW
jgi:ABC-type multidrug transport system fused ATPase/permease subunit